MPSHSRPVITVALPVPLRRAFDYVSDDASVAPGCRVQVNFNRRLHVGVVLGSASAPPGGDGDDLKPVLQCLDARPLLNHDCLSLLRWAADYYLHPVGEVIAAALPPALRRGKSADWTPPQRWSLTEAGAVALRELPARQTARRARLALAASGGPLPLDALTRTLADEGWLAANVATPGMPADAHWPALNPAQQQAVDGIAARGGIQLIEGVTGSGKTEVYLHAARACVEAGGQALILVPEIGLTPQLRARFAERFGDSVCVYHSGLADGARLDAWQRVRHGHARVLVGTRSAVWLPFQRLGLIVVDEEHDPSFKQQDAFRYSARDVACYRGKQAGCPVLLGSATPALETRHLASTGRYGHQHLPERIHKAATPRVECIDLRGQRLQDGLSPPLIKALDDCMAGDGQALLFLNRRGFAPLLLCNQCGWNAPCPSCDAHLTLHRGPTQLRCHHCGHVQPPPRQCPSCQSSDLRPIGEGTERLEAALATRYPGERIERFDTDRLPNAAALHARLDAIHRGEVRLLVGTQMLAKGHDFPHLNFVGIVSADQALFGADFRAIERMGALITQVAGRAGRSGQPARVLLQTHVPEHPLLSTLIQRGYAPFVDAVLAERRAIGLPPFAHLALLRADALTMAEALGFVEMAERKLPPVPGVITLPPQPASMARRGGRHRAQLLLIAAQRPALRAAIEPWVMRLASLKAARQVRWSIDVDPIDVF